MSYHSINAICSVQIYNSHVLSFHPWNPQRVTLWSTCPASALIQSVKFRFTCLANPSSQSVKGRCVVQLSHQSINSVCKMQICYLHVLAYHQCKLQCVVIQFTVPASPSIQSVKKRSEIHMDCHSDFWFTWSGCLYKSRFVIQMSSHLRCEALSFRCPAFHQCKLQCAKMSFISPASPS